MPSSSIAAGNKEVKQADKPEKNSMRGAYEHLTPVDATYNGLYGVGAHRQTIKISFIVVLACFETLR